MKSLKDLKVGEKGRVISVTESGAFRRRLFDMGITPGTEITLLKIAPLGDPLEILVRGYHLSLRKEQAEKIKMGEVERSEVYFSRKSKLRKNNFI